MFGEHRDQEAVTQAKGTRVWRRLKQSETGRVRERQTGVQQARETATEKAGDLLLSCTLGMRQAPQGFFLAAGSVFNALFMGLQSNSKQ